MIPPISLGSLGGNLGGNEFNIGGVGGLGTTVPSPAPTGSAKGGSFSNALTSAIGSLETTQANATQASAQLATGQLTDPTTAITAVENASLSMDFASQIRNQIETAATTLFQTQV
jgi:flagellar hook-basal body complex protein FliE